MRISDWSSDVCSSDLQAVAVGAVGHGGNALFKGDGVVHAQRLEDALAQEGGEVLPRRLADDQRQQRVGAVAVAIAGAGLEVQPVLALEHVQHVDRSEEHTSELQSLMRISYAVICLKKKNMTLHQTLN